MEAKIEEFNVKKQNAGDRTLTSPQCTKNFVDVVPIKTETTNKFKTQNSLRSAPTTDFSKNVTQRLT